MATRALPLVCAMDDNGQCKNVIVNRRQPRGLGLAHGPALLGSLRLPHYRALRRGSTEELMAREPRGGGQRPWRDRVPCLRLVPTWAGLHRW